jgi:hypothetical protein
MEKAFNETGQPILAWLPNEWDPTVPYPSGENTDIYLLANVATV